MTDKVNIQALIALISQIIKASNQMQIKYDAFLEGFDALEQNIGPLPIFSLAEELHEPHKSLRYKYLFKEISSSLSQLFGVLSRMFDEQLRIKEDQKTEEQKKELREVEQEPLWRFVLEKIAIKVTKFIFRGSNEDLLNRYCREWETLYNVFVDPICTNLQNNRQIPSYILNARKWKGRGFRTQYVKKYLEQDADTKILGSLLKSMNAELRNAIVHLNYYIDETSKAVVYFNLRQKKIQPKSIPLHDLETQLFLMIIARLVLFVTMGQRLATQLGIDWDDVKRSANNEKVT